MAGIDPGLFRTEVSLRGALRISDGQGGQDVGWTEAARFFAWVRPAWARQRFAVEGAEAVVTHRVTLRMRDDLASGMRLGWKGREAEIVTVRDPDETGRYLLCEAREIGR